MDPYGPRSRAWNPQYSLIAPPPAAQPLYPNACIYAQMCTYMQLECARNPHYSLIAPPPAALPFCPYACISADLTVGVLECILFEIKDFFFSAPLRACRTYFVSLGKTLYSNVGMLLSGTLKVGGGGFPEGAPPFRSTKLIRVAPA